MDASVIAAIARWPNVPNVYGWLSLDRRGKWRLQGSVIGNPHVTDFIDRNYEADERGAWFFQNGPQRVYVKLDYTPLILRIGDRQTLITHTGTAVQAVRAAFLDESGNLLIEFESGIGLIEDRDLPTLLDAVHNPAGKIADEEALSLLMNGGKTALMLKFNRLEMPLQSIRCKDIPARFGFIADPQPADLG